MLRVERHGFAEESNSLFRLTGLRRQIAQVVVRIGKGWVVPDGGQQMLFTPLAIAAPAEERSKIVVCLGIVRLDPYGFFIGLPSVGAAGVFERSSQPEPCLGEHRI